MPLQEETLGLAAFPVVLPELRAVSQSCPEVPRSQAGRDAVFQGGSVDLLKSALQLKQVSFSSSVRIFSNSLHFIKPPYEFL